MSSEHISRAELLSRYYYNEETGQFLMLGKRSRKVGIKVKPKYDKHVRIIIDGKTYRAHRLAWLYVYGEYPHMVLHKNKDTYDNSIKNLIAGRPSTRAQIQNNRSTSGTSGVYYDKKSCKWCARIGYSGKRIYLGAFVHMTDAVFAANTARRLLGEKGYSNQIRNS